MSKKKKIMIGGGILTIIAVIFFISTASAKDKYPVVDLSKASKGDFVTKEGFSKNKYYKAYPKKIKSSFSTIVVPENRTKENSKLISLPVKRLHSFSDNPKEPVFFLYGGPESSNLRRTPVVWLLENHDVVMVGYRGIDGDPVLETPEILAAMVSIKDAYSLEGIKKLAHASSKVFNRLESSGIDVHAYNMIEVLDDIEDARKALGYNKINFYSSSYGTRLAYLFGVRYPENVNRTMMDGVNPPGRFIWKAKDTEAILKKVADQWNNDPLCAEKSPDILATMAKVNKTLPYTWRKIDIELPRIKAMMFITTYQRNGFAQIFNAYVAAENGDYSGLAFLAMAYNQLPFTDGMSFGENFSKAMCADRDTTRIEEKLLAQESAFIGAPFSTLFDLIKFGGWPIDLIPEEYRKLQSSEVETLLLSGDIDVSTPYQYAKEMLEYLPNGHHVIFKNRGHQDIGILQNYEYHDLINTFYQEGTVDGSAFTFQPINFNESKPSFQKMGKMFRFIKRLGLTKFVSKFMN